MNRILIVEDEPDIQELLSAYLQQAGYQTSLAGDGVEALELFRSASFDLVLLDIMLPKIDGFGVCELIRQESQPQTTVHRIHRIIKSQRNLLKRL